MVAEDGTAPPSVGKASNHVLYTTPRNKGRRFRTSQRKCLLSGISLFLALALQKLPQFPAVCGYEIFFQWTGLELHHDIVVIGGDGSFNGASRLSEQGINTIGVPGTIDLDIACTEYTIGFDTAINTAMEAIDRLRDTSESHERCSIVEVMGRTAGHIALWTGIASGAEYILTTEEYHGDIQRIITKIQDRRKMGKKNHIIVNAEGIGNSNEMAKVIELATGVETRATILGHIQRGGNPTCKDRVYASAMGARAVELLCEGASNRVVGYHNGEFKDYDIQEALAMTKGLDPYLFHIMKKLTTRG